MKKLATLFLATAIMAMAVVPTFAAEFTPSVEAKPAPEVVAQTGADGKQYAAIIRNADGSEVVGVSADDLIVVPVAESGSASAEINAKLDSAYEQLNTVASLTELTSNLMDVVKEYSPSLKEEDLVVRDLFDVSVTGTIAEYLLAEGNSITVRFALSADADMLVAILHNIEGTTWETVTNDRITRNDDHTVDVVFYSLSPVAFLFDAGALSVDANAPDSPDTSEADASILGWSIAGGAVVLFAAAYIVMKKRSSQNA